MPAPSVFGGRPFQDHRRVVEAIVFRYRTGVPWRDLPSSFGPWQTAWKRHKRFSLDGTWDRIHAALLVQADAQGALDWTVSVDSTVNRAHQHATSFSRVECLAGRRSGTDTGGKVELHESERRAR
jgi:transposase